jgi:hypothetical protein
MSELSPSPFICANCGRTAMWKEVASDSESNIEALNHGTLQKRWWLSVPCSCGSIKYRVSVDSEDVKSWTGSYGTNG